MEDQIASAFTKKELILIRAALVIATEDAMKKLENDELNKTQRAGAKFFLNDVNPLIDKIGILLDSIDRAREKQMIRQNRRWN